jgi:dTDP-4-amino-4,6-dideoxygalactose transaminase
MDLEQKIISATKPAIVVVQHTFGLAADLDKINEVCQKHNLILLEDCAHCLGASFQNKKLGSFGKAAFFSFGRDKVISSVFGGLAVTNDDELAKKIGGYRNSLADPSYWWIFQQLLHPVLSNFLVIPLYNLGDLGKWMLILLQKLGLLSKAVKNEEKQGRFPKNFAKKMPDALAVLALNQLKKLDKILAHQREIAGFYEKNIKNPDFLLPSDIPGRIYMRYPLLAKTLETDKILNTARKYKIFLDDGWRKTVIVPPDTQQEKMRYQVGECPKAEKAAKTILNLPTHINISQEKAQRIINFLNGYPAP